MHQEDQELSRIIFEYAPDAYYLNDLKGTFIDGNRVAEELTGYSKEELIGKSLLNVNLLSADQIPKAVAALAQNAVGKATGPDEFTLYRKDGTKVTVEIRTHPVRMKNRTVVLGIARDITQRKLVEAAFQERAMRLELIARVGRSTTAILELDELLHQAVTLISDTFAYYNVIIMLVEDGELVLKATTLPSLRHQEGRVRLRIGSEGITGWVAGSGEPLLVPDVRTDSRYYAALDKMDTRSELAVPIILKGKVIGVLDAQSVNVNAFSEIDTFTLGALADQLAVAIDNARLYEQTSQEISERMEAEQALKRSRKKIEALHDTARTLETCQSENEVYSSTVEAAEHILNFTTCTLDIVKGEKIVRQAATFQMPQGTQAETDLDENSLAGKTIRTGHTIVCGSTDTCFEARPIQDDIKSCISSPLGDFGVFQAASTFQDAFTPEDIHLLEILLGHATEAIRNIRLRNELRHQADHDPLTGLYNRRYVAKAIYREVERSKRYGHSIGFMIIDVDQFKNINDTYGHQTGDRVLQEVASFLTRQVRATETVARYGGDEFLIVIPELREDMDAMIQRIHKECESWNTRDNSFGFPIALSIGSARWKPDGCESVEKILAIADQLMFREKKDHTALLESSQAQSVHAPNETAMDILSAEST